MYHPRGMIIWDSWFYVFRGKVHSIYIQLPRQGSTREARLSGSLGHAVTQDLVSWQELPVALYRGSPGTYDDAELWTGTVVENDGVLYLYYTGRSSSEGDRINRIALATSKDGITWEKWKENPIIEADGRWYANAEHPLNLYGHGYPIVDMRDLCVVRDPDGDGWWGFFCARKHSKTNAGSSVIGLCHSKDLINWEQFPPCFEPEGQACVEVPEVFCIRGRWYMLCLTGSNYGQRGGLSDPLVRVATLYAVSDDVRGPYRMLEDHNVVIGAVAHQGYCAKTLEWQSRRTMFYTQSEYEQDKTAWGHGSISMPVWLDADETGKLHALWHPVLDDACADALTGAPLDVSGGEWGSIGDWETFDGETKGSCADDWAILPFDPLHEDCVIDVDVELRTAKGAGLAFRIPGENIMARDGGCVTLLDPTLRQVIFTRLRNFPYNECRTWDIRSGGKYHLRVMITGYVFMIYIDNRLAIQCYESCARTGRIALYVEKGEALFSNFRVRRLKSGAVDPNI